MLSNLIGTIAVMACLSISKQVASPDFNLICYEVMAEAGGDGAQSIEACATVILNRVESPRFPDTVREVIEAPGAFCDPSGYYTAEVERYVYRAVIRHGTDHQIVPYNCYYFRAGNYHSFGIPYTHYGNTYFSLSEEASL